MARNGLDPAGLEVLWTRLIGLVDESAATQERTSFSTMVREANDYAVVLTDAAGRLLAQNTRSIPSFIGTLPRTIRLFLKRFPAASLRPGDVIVTNDPWIGTGHLPDINMAVPIFRQGRLVAFAGSVTHVPDIGGRLWNLGIRELYEEGLQIPPFKLVAAGRPNRTLIELIGENVRVPEQTLGDIWAQVSACRMLERGLVALIDETGVEVGALGTELRRRAEAAMRAAIRALPDGDYRSRIENDGFEEPVVIACRLAVRGDRILVDYAGSSPQLARAVNSTISYTRSYTAYALKCLLAPGVPNNEGSYAPVRVEAPLGSVVNPRYPAPVGARNTTGQLLPPAVMLAFAEALPERVVAPSGAPPANFTISGAHRGRRYAMINFLNGGFGASAARDGLAVTSFPSNVSNVPIEVIESLLPVRILRRGIRKRTGGRGLRRGGDGQSLAFEFAGEAPGVVSFSVTRRLKRAPGAHGGAAGAPSRLLLNGRPIDPARHWVLSAGDRVLIETAGGGGYGARRR
ncbi:MAG: hydantoinase B/oxoprolinase family protein [Proteobacteria bacterium]|nr:hydantoinase B/oxoprolinase family protein [Pseudomonadota bacterium]